MNRKNKLIIAVVSAVAILLVLYYLNDPCDVKGTLIPDVVSTCDCIGYKYSIINYGPVYDGPSVNHCLGIRTNVQNFK